MELKRSSVLLVAFIITFTATISKAGISRENLGLISKVLLYPMPGQQEVDGKTRKLVLTLVETNQHLSDRYSRDSMRTPAGILHDGLMGPHIPNEYPGGLFFIYTDQTGNVYAQHIARVTYSDRHAPNFIRIGSLGANNELLLNEKYRFGSLDRILIYDSIAQMLNFSPPNIRYYAWVNGLQDRR